MKTIREGRIMLERLGDLFRLLGIKASRESMSISDGPKGPQACLLAALLAEKIGFQTVLAGTLLSDCVKMAEILRISVAYIFGVDIGWVYGFRPPPDPPTWYFDSREYASGELDGRLAFMTLGMLDYFADPVCTLRDGKYKFEIGQGRHYTFPDDCNCAYGREFAHSAIIVRLATGGGHCVK